jgi:hypothetical protein
MEVSGELHVQAALPTRGKVQEAGWIPERSEICGEEKNLAPAGNQTPAVQPFARTNINQLMLFFREMLTVNTKKSYEINKNPVEGK